MRIIISLALLLLLNSCSKVDNISHESPESMLRFLHYYRTQKPWIHKQSDSYKSVKSRIDSIKIDTVLKSEPIFILRVGSADDTYRENAYYRCGSNDRCDPLWFGPWATYSFQAFLDQIEVRTPAEESIAAKMFCLIIFGKDQPNTQFEIHENEIACVTASGDSLTLGKNSDAWSLKIRMSQKTTLRL